MSQSIAIPHQTTAGRELGRRHHLLAGGALGLILGALGLASATAAVPYVRAALGTESSVATVGSAGPELPREWRWAPKGVEYEHMYRQKGSPRLDWIREGRAR